MSDQANPRREVVVDGERFALSVTSSSYRLEWLSGPNPNYGLGGTLVGGGSSADRAAFLANLFSDAEITAMARDFLREIDPATGYLYD